MQWGRGMGGETGADIVGTCVMLVVAQSHLNVEKMGVDRAVCVNMGVSATYYLLCAINRTTVQSLVLIGSILDLQAGFDMLDRGGNE